MVNIANFRVMHCNWIHKLNSEFLNIVANEVTHSQKYVVE